MGNKEVHKDIYLPLYCDNNARPIKYTLFWKHTHTDWNIFLLIHFFIWKVTCKRKTHCGLILTWFYCHTISEKRANTLCKNEVMFTKKKPFQVLVFKNSSCTFLTNALADIFLDTQRQGLWVLYKSEARRNVTKLVAGQFMTRYMSRYGSAALHSALYLL